MVERHHKWGFQVARICLSEEQKQVHPLLKEQFSIFELPGQAVWGVVGRSMGAVVPATVWGHEAWNAYCTLCGNLPSIVDRFVYDKQNKCAVEAKDEQAIDDISECTNCTNPEQAPCCDRVETCGRRKKAGGERILKTLVRVVDKTIARLSRKGKHGE